MGKAIQPGGAYLSEDGKTWHDSMGKVIPAPDGKVSVSDAEAPKAEGDKKSKKKQESAGEAEEE